MTWSPVARLTLRTSALLTSVHVAIFSRLSRNAESKIVARLARNMIRSSWFSLIAAAAAGAVSAADKMTGL